LSKGVREREKCGSSDEEKGDGGGVHDEKLKVRFVERIKRKGKERKMEEKR